jgi:hypothetical protein
MRINAWIHWCGLLHFVAKRCVVLDPVDAHRRGITEGGEDVA